MENSPNSFYETTAEPGLGQSETIAALLSGLWLVGCGLVFFLLPSPDGADLRLVRYGLAGMVVVLPIAMIWVAALTLKATRIMREESRRMHDTMDALRKTTIKQAQGGISAPSVERKLDGIAASLRKSEAALNTLSTARLAPGLTAMVAPQQSTHDAATDTSVDQPSLALDGPSAPVEELLAVEDFIHALNFPETAEDVAGFAALRRALKDRTTAQLIQASQDVLTLMSQDGIYMDDLTPDLARTELWRAFAEGTRGRAIADLGGIRDRDALALVASRMKQDPIFRDAGHHFLRVFDRVYAAFAERASDEEIQAFARTRTALAFMLMGRVAGTFD